jgi:ribosomal-protein-alanine N-acetyltransferase
VRKYLFDDEILPPEVAADIVQKSLGYFADVGYGLWALTRREADDTNAERLIGVCGFWFFHEPPELELLYMLSEDCWGRGLAVEAARAVMQYGFAALGMTRIQASTDAPNVASVRVMEKLGMTFLKQETRDGLDTIFYVGSRE